MATFPGSGYKTRRRSGWLNSVRVDSLRSFSRRGYLAKQAGYTTANRVEGELYEAFSALAEVPGQGHRREDLTHKDLLFFAVYSYMIVFRIADPIEIVRVLHGRRNLKRLLKP